MMSVNKNSKFYPEIKIFRCQYLINKPQIHGYELDDSVNQLQLKETPSIEENIINNYRIQCCLLKILPLK